MFPKTAAVITSMMLVAQPAVAQSVTPLFPNERAPLYRPDAAGTRREPEFAPQGIAVGGFRAHPRIEVSAAHDSNVFNAEGAAARDAPHILVRPSLRLASDWGRHELELSASGSVQRYEGFGSEDNEQYELGASGRYDLDYASAVHANVGFARLAETRGAGGPVNAGAERSAYREFRSALGFGREFGPLRLRAAASVATRRYEDVGPVDQSFRNVRVLSVMPRLDYALSPQLGLFAKGAWSATGSLDAAACCVRDSSGGTALLGIRGELGRLLIGEVAVGWRKRDFERPQFLDFDGFAFDARIDWYPTELISIRLDATQDIENSGIATVAGIVTRTAQLSVYYDPLPNLRLTGALRYANEKYRELSIDTDTLTASIRADYALNPNLSLGLRVNVRDRGSSSPQAISEYDGHELGVSIAYAM